MSDSIIIKCSATGSILFCTLLILFIGHLKAIHPFYKARYGEVSFFMALTIVHCLTLVTGDMSTLYVLTYVPMVIYLWSVYRITFYLKTAYVYKHSPKIISVDEVLKLNDEYHQVQANQLKDLEIIPKIEGVSQEDFFEELRRVTHDESVPAIKEGRINTRIQLTVAHGHLLKSSGIAQRYTISK